LLFSHLFIFVTKQKEGKFEHPLFVCLKRKEPAAAGAPKMCLNKIFTSGANKVGKDQARKFGGTHSHSVQLVWWWLNKFEARRKQMESGL
jgi:hypothetical protein